MHLAIVGAGIGGLAASVFLERSGHTVSVFETFKKAKPLGAGLLLQPPGQAILAELGCLSELEQTAVPIRRLYSKTAAGKRLMDLSYSDLPRETRHGLGIQRQSLHSSLLHNAKATTTEFHFDATVCGLERQPKGVYLKTDTGHKHGPFDLVIIASGTGSKWLENTAFMRRAPQYPWGCMWATVPMPKGLDPNTLHQRCSGSQRMLGLLPVEQTSEGHKAALYWSIRNTDSVQWNEQPFSDFKEHLITLWPEVADAIAGADKSDFVHATYRDVWCPNFYQDRVCVIGDAAHGTSPQLGQGCSMALLDAKALAQTLGNNVGDLAANFRRYAALRKKQLLYVRFASRLLTPFFQHHSRLYGRVRDLTLGPLLHSRPFYQLGLRTLASDVFLQADQIINNSR